MLRTAQLLPPPWLLTLGFDPARFQTEPPACYRASWQLPGPDSHRLATTSFPSGHDRWTITSSALGARNFGLRGPHMGVPNHSSTRTTHARQNCGTPSE